MLVCQKVKGGKRPLWHARLHSDYVASFGIKGRIVGASSTADGAIRDFQEQFREVAKLQAKAATFPLPER